MMVLCSSPHLLAEQIDNDSEYADGPKMNCSIDDIEMGANDIEACDTTCELTDHDISELDYIMKVKSSNAAVHLVKLHSYPLPCSSGCCGSKL